jgi:hypothetical protein
VSNIQAGSSVLGVATRRDVALGPHLVPEELKAPITIQPHPSGSILNLRNILRHMCRATHG